MPIAKHLPEPILLDQLSGLLEHVIERLEEIPTGDVPEEPGLSLSDAALGVVCARRPAGVHHNVREGMREVAHLRNSIFAVCAEEQVTMTPHDAEIVASALDAVVTASAAELDRAALVLYQRAMAFVAHELRNPLSAIVMGVARLQSENHSGAEKAVQIVARNALLAERLVADLLTISNLEAGDFVVQCHEVDARAIVRDTCDQLSTKGCARAIDLQAHIPSAVISLDCDADRMMQALGNLVANALKFTPAGGRVDVSLEAEPQRCTFRVADTGPGIDPRNAAFIFQPFWQAPETQGQGTGLGLAIARRIVEAHGGTLALEPSERPGATFSITLPRTHRPSFVSGSIPPDDRLALGHKQK